ncbi:MAG: hypothetical protein ABI700_28230 [Chloroflexota bacterium]
MNIWDYQRILVRRLIQWALISLGIGTLLSGGNRFWRAVGGQFIGWALINLGIAWFGIRTSEDRRVALPDQVAPEVLEREAESLRRLLWINTALDLLYVAGGRWLIKRGSRGTGWGIVLQGMFLFLFDLFHAGGIPDASKD